jgi:signal transduction histidine kinase
VRDTGSAQSKKGFNMSQIQERQKYADAVDAWASSVSHEIRNNLSNVLYSAAVLKIKSGNPKMVLAAAKNIDESVDAMQSIIDDLMDRGAFQRGKFSVIRKWIKANSMSEQIKDSQTHHANQDCNKVVIDLKGMIFCDHGRIIQVAKNLINNALKFTRDGTITMRGREGKDGYFFEIRDTGSGISEADLAHVFDRFWQSDKADKQTGIGLGLSITQDIVESHGGHITVRSILGKGTSFYITLPIEKKKTRNKNLPVAEAALWTVQEMRAQTKQMRELALQMRNDCIASRADNERMMEYARKAFREMAADPLCELKKGRYVVV